MLHTPSAQQSNANVLHEAVSEAVFAYAETLERGDISHIWVDWEEVHTFFKEPAGFEFVGAGGARCSFLKDGVIYKIDYAMIANPHGGQSTSEWRHYQAFMERTDLPEILAIPEMDCVFVGTHPVIVAEYIVGDEADDWYSDTLNTVRDALNLGDLYGPNVVFSNGRWYVLDLAM